VRSSISWPEAFRALFGTVGLSIGLAGGVSGGEVAADRLDKLPPADVVIIGEIHGNAVHHENQARAVAALQPRALVFEMLTPAQAARTPVDRSDAVAMALAYGWAESGWPAFGLYHPIFAAAPNARIYPGDLPRGEIRRAVSDGAAAVFGAEAGRYGLDEPLDPADQAAREAEQQAAHCNALPAHLLPGMVEAQRLRDAVLARAVVQAMAETGGPVAVITGAGHARTDLGVPAVLHRAAPSLRVLSIGQVEGEAGAGQPFDLWIETEAPVREDPCAAFGEMPAEDG
jgi:uncharacterized iron-regulated protein